MSALSQNRVIPLQVRLVAMLTLLTALFLQIRGLWGDVVDVMTDNFTPSWAGYLTFTWLVISLVALILIGSGAWRIELAASQRGWVISLIAAMVASAAFAMDLYVPVGRLLLTLVGIAACLMTIKRVRGAGLVMLGFWIVTLANLVSIASRFLSSLYRDDWITLLFDRMQMRSWVGINSATILQIASDITDYLVIVGIAIVVASRLMRSPAVREWFGFAAEPTAGHPSNCAQGRKLGTSLRILLVSGLLYTLWFGVAIGLVDTIWSDSIFSWVSGFLSVPEPKPYLRTDLGLSQLWHIILPFLAAAGLILWRTTERIAIDSRGVRLFLYHERYTLFNVPWARLRRVDVVRHKRRPPTYVLHYRSRLGLPFSLGIHPKRYSDPSALQEALDQAIAQSSKPVRVYVAAEWKIAAAWSFVFFGAALAIAQLAYSGWMMREFALDRLPWERMREYVAILPLSLMNLFTVACFGIALGLLSAYHRGGARPVLMGLWMNASLLIPGPVLHWLVWIAMYAILSARLQPVETLPWIPAPTGAEWDLGFILLGLAPLVAGLSYLLGVIAGRRPLRTAPALAQSSQLEPLKGPAATDDRGQPQIVPGVRWEDSHLEPLRSY